MPEKTNPIPIGGSFEIPQSLKRVLEGLPAPEAIQVIDDIGKVAWVVDNNNNNKASVLEDQFLNEIARVPVERLREVLRSVK